jgi:hypothetical protein
VLRFKSLGYELSGLKLPPNGRFDPIGLTYPQRMPFGTVAIYSGWLVFLTESHNPPGRVPAPKELLPTFIDQVREAARYETIGGLLRESYRVLSTPSGRERMRRLLGNPNSRFIPLASIKSARIVRRGEIHARMIVTTLDGREFCFAPHGLMEFGPSLGRVIESWFSDWQPDVLGVLRAAAERNTDPGKETLRADL